MTQPNVFETSAPAAPAGDAQFVAATTAPPTFVFRPGATFPTGGIGVQQNVYTTPVSIGTDGLVMLQGILQGLGVGATPIPLPSSVVELDFSLVSNDYALAADLNLGAFCRFHGLQTDAFNPPELDTAGFTITGLVAIDSVLISVSGQTALTANPSHFEVFTNGGIVSSDGNYFIDAGTGIFTVEVHDAGYIGDGTNPVFHVASGGTLFINLYDTAGLDAACLAIDAGGTVNVNVISPSVYIDESLYTLAGIGWTYGFAPVPVVTYQPAGQYDAGATFTDFHALLGYINAVGVSANGAWTIRVDTTYVGTALLTLSAAWPGDVTLQGINTENGNQATVDVGTGTGAFDLIANPAPYKLTLRNISLVNKNATTPWISTAGTTLQLFLEENASMLMNAATQPPFIAATAGAFLYVRVDGSGSITNGAAHDTAITIDSASSGDFQIFDFAVLGSAAVTAAAASSVTIEASAEASIGASYIAPDFVVTYKASAAQVTYNNSLASPSLSGTVTQVQEAIDAIKPSVDFPVNNGLTLTQLQALGATASATVILIANPAPAGTRITQPEIQILQAFAAVGLVSATVTMQGSIDAAGTLVSGADAMTQGNYGLGTNPYPSRAGQGIQYTITLTGATFNNLTAGHINGRIVDQVSQT